MFTGIIEDQAEVIELIEEKNNITFLLKSRLATNFKIDESIAHNGVCLTVEDVNARENKYRVTAIAETLSKTNLGLIQVKDKINLERALRADSRLDGHFVQGHVDCVGEVARISKLDGSCEYEILFNPKYENLVIGRGSICVNGISLTIAKNNTTNHTLTVCIIPHTIKRTNIGSLGVGDKVNLEFDVLGKYVEKLISLRTT